MVWSTLWTITLVVMSLTLFGIACATLWWQMHAWRTPETYEGVTFPKVEDVPATSFSLIMPARDESEEVMTATIDALLAQDHPDFEIVVSVGHDDLDTVAIAHRLAARDPHLVRVSVNTEPVKNKPRQLNTSLAMCTKDVVGVIDAESITHPHLLRRVDTTFRVRHADVVQGAVHLVNYRATWFSLRNCLEYRTWFRSRLQGHALAGFVPLGGNTVFMKRALIEEVGGWDGDCLAEDCDLGVRFSALGKTIVCAYDGDLATQEEAPVKIKAFLKQRTRWALGFMQVLAKGDWRRLPTRRERVLAWWTLVQNQAMAFAGICLPVAVLSALLFDPPVPVVMLTFLPAVPTVAMVAFEVLILREFGRDMGFRIRITDYLKMMISTPFYQFLLAIASIRAGWKFYTGDFAWEKTAHEGAHLTGLAGRPAGRVRESVG